MEQARIPQYVDELPQVFFWEADEALFLVVGLFGGIISGAMFQGAIIGVFIASTFAKFKVGKNRGMLVHSIYWLGVFPIRNKAFKNGLSRFFTS